MKIVLLGSIPKGDKIRKTWTDWKVGYTEKITKSLPDAEFLHGDLISDKEGPEAVVGHDLYLIKHCDVAIVNAENQIGAGTAQEIVMAKIYKKPVVIIMPKGSHHRKQNIVFEGKLTKDFIHPFLYVASDYIAEDLDDAIRWIKRFNKNPKMKIKDIKVMDETIKYFSKKFASTVREFKKAGW